MVLAQYNPKCRHIYIYIHIYALVLSQLHWPFALGYSTEMETITTSAIVYTIPARHNQVMLQVCILV